MALKAVLFDKDGTLIDFRTSHGRRMRSCGLNLVS